MDFQNVFYVIILLWKEAQLISESDSLTYGSDYELFLAP